MEATAWARMIVGVPAHNEEASIGAVVAGALAYAPVVVVDDGSTDRTTRVASRAGAIVIRHRNNRGKGAAVATLLDYAREQGVEVLIMLDGDGQHDPEDIPAVAAPCLRGEADVVVGSRYLTVKSDVPAHRIWGQRAFNIMTAAASGVRCSDSQSGFRAFGRRAICSVRITEKSFSVECEQQFEFLAHSLRLAEVPIRCSYAVPEKRSAYVQGVHVLRRLTSMAIRRRLLQRPPASPPSPPPADRLAEDVEPVVVMAAD